MKTALSLLLALATTTAFTEPPPVTTPPGLGGPVPLGYIASGSFCTRTQGPADAIAKPSNGKWPWGGRRATAIVCTAAMKADRFDGRF